MAVVANIEAVVANIEAVNLDLEMVVGNVVALGRWEVEVGC